VKQRSSAAAALASDDQQARKVRLPRLGQGVVSAPRIERPFAARLEKSEQSPGARRPTLLAAASTCAGVSTRAQRTLATAS
jgi:hypothetical protein